MSSKEANKNLDSFILVSILALNILYATSAFCQINPIGIWDGNFMDNFRISLVINSDTSGTIKTFSFDEVIQNDVIKILTLNNEVCSFEIPVKRTIFNGKFIDDGEIIDGKFIFPDGSVHQFTGGKVKNAIPDQENLSFTLNQISQKQQYDDLLYLFEKIKTYHPQLYNYISKDNLDVLFAETIKSLESVDDVVSFYYKIAPIIDAIKCSHTGIRLPFNILQWFEKYGNPIPIELAFISNNAYVLKNCCDSSINFEPGSEVLKINNIDITEIISDLQPSIPSEGKNTTTKNNYLNRNFNSLFLTKYNAEEYKVTLKQNGVVQTCTLYPCDSVRKINNKDQSTPVHYSKKNDYGLLVVNSFAYPDINEYISILDGIFKSINDDHIQNLILDLRNNAGGHPIFATQLLSYLTDSSFIYFKRNPDVVEFEPLCYEIYSCNFKFNGNIYVWVNGGCLSTTGHLISLMNYYSKAVFIGEQPGSTYSCNDFSLQFVLPNSKIELNVPRTTFETAVSELNDVSFHLDHNIDITIYDLLNENDVYLEYTLSLIDQNSTQHKDAPE